MKRSSFLYASLVLLLPAAARAELISWSYDWGSSTASVAAGGAGTGGINLSTPTGNVVGGSDIVAANLSTFSAALPGSPDTFTNTLYNLNIKVTDAASGLSGLINFSGKFNGTVTPTSANVTTTFDSPTTKSIHLGSNTYQVTLGPYTAPGAPGATTTGSIGAHVNITPDVGQPPPPPPPAHDTPEPSSLVLTSLGLLGVGGKAWQSWRRGRRASS